MRVFLTAIVVLLLCNSYTSLNAQSSFSGTFMTQDGSWVLRLKPVQAAYHGTLQSIDGVFALQATVNGEKMSGTIYTSARNFAFTASPKEKGLSVAADGKTYQFQQTSADHELANVDLSPFFGHSTEAAPKNSGDYEGEQRMIFDQIAGSQLVFYTRTSYLNDSKASSITYVNFCGDGRFNLNYDGSFSVEGDYGNAQGASNGSNYGTWQVDLFQGNPIVTLFFADGTKSVNPVNKANLQAGRWRVGNTQYAIQRNKAVCR